LGRSQSLLGRFLFDTGASTTLLSAPLRQRLGLVGTPVAPDGLAYAVAGKQCPTLTATRLTLPLLKIQDVTIRQLQALQFDQTLIPEGADGVLGMDVLAQFQVTVDPQQRRLSLGPPQPLSPAQRLQAIPLEVRSGVRLAQLWINAQGPFTVLVDTGADGTFISGAVAKKLGLGGPSELGGANRKPIQMLGFCGLEDAEQTHLNHVSLQSPLQNPPPNYRQTSLDAVITDSSILRTLGIDGVLGQNFLNQYRQTWHLSKDKISKDETQDKNWLVLELTQPR
ncbi:MAG: clan AA aspartic protease, partial [Synechococcales cyanobacterium RU_4_20]|nr:clan AA aspartic protease [Synechococcales cyanobacterium RU_4_20]